MTRFPARWSVAAVAAAAMGLASCAQQGGLSNPLAGIADVASETLATWPVPNGTAALRRNRLDGSFDIVVEGTAERAVFSGYSNVVLRDARPANGDVVATFVGSKADCPNRYMFVVFAPTGIQGFRMPTCGPDYEIGGNGRVVAAKQLGARDPLVWIVENRQLRGPWHQSALAGSLPSPASAGPAWTPPPQIQVRDGSGAGPSPVPVGPRPQAVPSVRLD